MILTNVATSEEVALWDGTTRGYVPREPLPINASLNLHQGSDSDVDPITYEVVRNALTNINLEHADMLQRLSLSPIVMLARDFQASLLTEDADLVCIGAGVVYFSNQNALTIKYILEHFEEGEIQAGDMFLASDPYIGSAHQSDVTIIAPIFSDGRLFGWIANSMHFSDVGGSVPGSQCVGATDVWQEPMLVPPITLIRDGKLRRDIESMFVRQSRYPTMTRMDVRAAVGGATATRDKVERLLERYGADVVKSVMRRVVDAGERLFVERLQAIPDGRWSHRTYIEGAFPGDRQIHAQQITITKRGDWLMVDNEGTAPQLGGGNITFAGLSGIVLAAITQQMVPDLAGAYGGAYRRVVFNPTSGLMNCAEYPGAVSASGIRMAAVQCNVAGAVVSKMLACGDDVARSLPLGPCSPNLNSLIGAGLDSNGSPFLLIDANGLMGSLAGRPQRDGVDAGGQWWIPDAMAYNSEDLEAQGPVVVLARKMINSGIGGSGRHRAGVGYHETLMIRGVIGGEMINYQNESFTTGQGLFGGNPGSMAQCRILRKTDVHSQLAAERVPITIEELAGEEEVLTHVGPPFPFGDGDIIQWVSPAAPGYGDPLLRDPALVKRDLEDLLVDVPTADRVYGVVFTGDQVDLAATAARRLSIRRERLGGAEPGQSIEAPYDADRVGDLLYVVNGRWWCNGADLGPATANYKDRALTRDTLIRHLAPEHEVANTDMADRVRLREYLCPVTGLRIDAELIADDDEPLHDILIQV
ncbi:hydantoinase B/oxoprolinase family protein [Parafrankia sp. EUN1f]|uniref:hydantoinase B/oxoprolinase family protein n=1 Tax=Parafrankia sp. EUN1f TaxID=102897 RepID=UPI0001C43ABA|nr:hydantoinase B/oxoprolinase family protein [Parafrankia sp. EUN1f]EFC83486.1 Hydantoinase B/oxoprolinase [Parafrankia sp. EUN1f]